MIYNVSQLKYQTAANINVKHICTDDVESNIKQKGKRRTKKAVLTGQVNKGTSNSCACRKKKLITFLRAFPVYSVSTHTCARKE